MAAAAFLAAFFVDFLLLVFVVLPMDSSACFMLGVRWPMPSNSIRLRSLCGVLVLAGIDGAALEPDSASPYEQAHTAHSNERMPPQRRRGGGGGRGGKEEESQRVCTDLSVQLSIGAISDVQVLLEVEI